MSKLAAYSDFRFLFKDASTSWSSISTKNDFINMHSFKVISTVENNRIFVSAVPHQWEQDKILKWPENYNHRQREAVRSDASSQPGNEWKKYQCVLKCSNILNFKEALQIEKQITNCLNTDEEECIFDKKKKTIVNQVIDRNNLFHSNVISSPTSMDNMDTINDLQENYYINNHTIINDTNNIASNDAVSIAADHIEENTVVLIQSAVLNDLSTDMKRIKEEYIKINTNLDKIYKLLMLQQNESHSIPKEPNENINLLKDFNFPLQSCDNVTQLEKEIQRNPDFKLNLVKELSKIGGTNGDQEGIRVGYKLTDWLFSSELLTQYSWTGVSRIKSGPEKKSFSALEGILSVFFETIKLADNRHNNKKNENIFKEGVLKHSKKRNLRKRLRIADANPDINDSSISNNVLVNDETEINFDEVQETQEQKTVNK